MAYDASKGMTALFYGIEGAASLASAYEQSTALQAQGEFQTTMARINQQFADIQAKNVITQGGVQANQIRKRGENIAGAQRATAAAQGIDVNDAQGSASAEVDDTKLMEATDMATAHSNAWKAAWGIQTQSAIGVSTAQFNKSGEDFAANSTLLTGGLKALGAAAKVGGIYAKNGTVSKTTDAYPYPTGLSPGGLLDRSIYGQPQDSSNYYGGSGWWQTPSEGK